MNIYFGENLKQLRQKQDFTQEKLAEFFGVSFQTISKWERGDTYPDITMLPEIALFFKISVDELLGVNKTENEDEIIKLLTEFDNYLNDTEKQDELIEYMIKKFPNDFRVQVRHLGMLSCKVEKDNVNEYLPKIQAIYSNIQNNCTNDEVRIRAKHLMASLYNRLAYYGNNKITFKDVENILMEMPRMRDSRELLISYIYPPTEPRRTELSMNSVETELSCLYHGLFHYAFFDYFNVKGEYVNGKYEKEYIIELLEKCLKMLDFFYDDGNYGVMWRTVAYDYGHLGHLYFEIGNEDKAIENLRKSAELAKKFDAMDRITTMKSKLFYGKTFDKHTLGSTYIASSRMYQLMTEKYPLSDEFKQKDDFKEILMLLE